MKKVLITGSTSGIGKAIAKSLVNAGYYVIIHCSGDIEKAESVRCELNAQLAVVADLKDEKQARELRSKTGDIDILILNASVQHKQNWLDAGSDEIHEQLNVNIVSSLILMQEYYPHMRQQKFGRIITIGSVNQFRNHPELTVYSATKCALSGIVKNIAKQAARDGITVNNIAPGAIVTPRNSDVYNDTEKRKAVESTIPVGRFGMPDECTGIVKLLCSDEGAYITGTDISVDGGMKL